MALKFYKMLRCYLSSSAGVKLWLVIICVIPFLGCASSPPGANQHPPRPVLETKDSISIAVLPIMDKTNSNGMATLFRDAFYSQLSVRRYRDVELHLIDRTLAAQKLSEPDLLYTQPKKDLGRMLNSDLLIFGEITTNQKLFFGVYSQMAVGATITIWDAQSGHMLWADRHIVRLHEGGVPLSLLEIPFLSFRSGYNLREKVKMRAVDELSRYLTGRIPDVASALFTSQVSKNPPVDETEIKNPEKSTRQNPQSEQMGEPIKIIPPTF